MDPSEAQESLDHIGHLRERAGAEYVRDGYSRTSVLVSTLALFAVFASFDLPGPWNVVVLGVGEAALLAFLALRWRRSAVRRRLAGPEIMLYAWSAAVLIAVFVVSLIAVRMLDLPAGYTIAAGALALANLALARWTRPLLAGIIRIKSA